MELHQALFPSKYKRKGDLVHETIHMHRSYDGSVYNSLCVLAASMHGPAMDVPLTDIKIVEIAT